MDLKLWFNGDGLKVTQTLREWIEKEGRCLLSSTEMP
jgi:hypothetical protein